MAPNSNLILRLQTVALLYSNKTLYFSLALALNPDYPTPHHQKSASRIIKLASLYNIENDNPSYIYNYIHISGATTLHNTQLVRLTQAIAHTSIREKKSRRSFFPPLSRLNHRRSRHNAQSITSRDARPRSANCSTRDADTRINLHKRERERPR